MLSILFLIGIDRIILDISIASIEAINQQIDTVSKDISKYAGDNKDVKILLSYTDKPNFTDRFLANSSL